MDTISMTHQWQCPAGMSWCWPRYAKTVKHQNRFKSLNRVWELLTTLVKWPPGVLAIMSSQG